MKKITILLLACMTCLILQSQNSVNKNLTEPDCETFTVIKEDQVTGQKTKELKETLVVSDDGENGIIIQMYQIDDEGGSILSMRVVGAGLCVDDKAKANILFTDGSRLELISNTTFNCDKDWTMYFGDVFGNTKPLKLLQAKKIKTMRVWTHDDYMESNFSDEQATIFQMGSQCIM